MEQMQFKVVVECFTFNQACFISDALDGFSKQMTSFPYVCCILDDASTDGEQGVIVHYLETHFKLNDSMIAYRKETDNAKLIFAQHKSNTNCYFAVILLHHNHYSRGLSKDIYLEEWRSSARYVALCEGDDYWLSQDKLERQVIFLDNHPDCSLCYHASKIVFSNDYTGLRTLPKFTTVKESYEFRDTIKGYPFQTATVVFRKELLYDSLYQTAIREVNYSKILFMVAAYRGKVNGFNEQLSVYRKNEGGISNSIDKGSLALKRISAYTKIANLFPKREKRIMHRVYILYLIWESYILTPFSDSQFYSLLLTEAKESPLTSLHLLLRFFKRKLIKL